MTHPLIPNRIPRPFDPDRGAEARARVHDVTPEQAELLAGTAACSPYLAGLIEKEADWIAQALQDPDAALADTLQTVAALEQADLMSGLRQAKRRVALLTALADLGEVWPLEQVTGALTALADAACDAALRAGIATQIKRGKLPGMGPDDVADAGGMVVLAMGKMGAGELNYSSDIDLICLFDESRFDPADYQEARAAFVRATRAMSAALNDITGEGYVFRTDLRLRPDPAVTPVCLSMEAAERYYESLGRTWERAAYIKARPAAGDKAAGEKFLTTLRPFVWRRHLDFAAIQDAHDMRLAIREHKGLGGPITLPDHNMKLGRGGIREIEFFTQTRQLIAGGRDADLRVRGTVPGLQVLSEKGWIPAEVATRLTDHYRAHRTVEHRLQMVRDAQTHRLPATDKGFERLAAMMDTDVDSLKTDLRTRLEAVHEDTEGFFAPSAPSEAPDKVPDIDLSITNRWPTYPALRNARGAAVFERIRPIFLEKLSRAARPDEALRALDGFLAGLPAGVQLFSLFEANPQLVDLLIDIVGTSPALAKHLSQNAGVFDAVIGGAFFDAWPELPLWQADLESALQDEGDYESRLDIARRWAKEWHFRIGVHLLRGVISAQEAATHYSDLARICMRGLWPVVVDDFARRFGPPPGRGAAVLGMGSLGAGTLSATSDLDMIVIYDPLDADASDGPKSLATRPYYARLTQALITAITTNTAQGKLYEVDMRLRPSGNQGPVATSWASFQDYQSKEAWTWEHLALTRAQAIAGPQDLIADIEAFRQSLMRGPRDRSQTLRDVADMRARIAAAKHPAGPWDTKLGRGRLQDIELASQLGGLLSGRLARDVASGVAGGVECGLWDQEAADVLLRAYGLCFDMQIAVRLLTQAPLDTDALGQGGTAFLLRITDQPDVTALAAALADRTAAAADVIDMALPEVKET
ncbi:glutamine-synthetase adenylyltransferase [Sulfitobacter pseudonitzschiae]|uniref:Glutamine-synthetase adenylyltransferase n=1 Tax=Pseudosulfitobacter pseudonitzschiae TaxID=1402135 RepID=A0A9Q2NFR8_9RHOB|nr:glutamine-synthetase adenylyltransferase [Pseudosulfitobacter pseudonitzschiae]MBM2291058.1 glutamine-synthetase adenylyltransferase [Pseudosulfitobacter pseudonitzschiae]MBM2295976.1 glutamine-synthetase adenylyltransferase [Pseudosulfitobacter pseudonitzschiae]MBM2300889.1 glutamine-synthetase adenylyltransferase [Pseudosulfitobacter pseudonitzschiae]MBM2310673.1 glutamine-synthetase adenylyltransferase [Pseudosulfitobacter pseudonitzschiae]MBM2315586.1 glutamine-synthetase adenylyltransf